MSKPTLSKMPVLFTGHGSPMNAIQENAWSQRFAALGTQLPKPKAILAISAHWYIDGTYVMANEQPRMIHDFAGFPRALFDVQYPAPGHTDLATRIARRLDEWSAQENTDWGLDHGTWSVLRWMYPHANVPILQLNIDRRQSPQYHWEIGQSLAPLRDEGILILGSGNVAHNLRDAI